MKHFFNILVYLYLLSYLFPFVDAISGIELEYIVWHAMLENRIPPIDLATIWSLRWLVNILIMALWFLQIPALNYWVSIYVDKPFLDKLLLGIVTIFVLYPFAFGAIDWDWGGVVWAILSIGIVVNYQFLEKPTLKENHYSLDEHLVE